MSNADERFLNRNGDIRNAAVVRYAGGAAVPKSFFARPAGARMYAVGAMVLPDAAQPLTFMAARPYSQSLMVVKARLWKSTPNLAGAAFVLHLFSEQPTPTGVDGDPFMCDKSRACLGSLDIFNLRALADGASGVGAPSVDGPISVELAEGQRTIYGVLEVRGNYAGGDAEEFEVSLEVQQD